MKYRILVGFVKSVKDSVTAKNFNNGFGYARTQSQLLHGVKVVPFPCLYDFFSRGIAKTRKAVKGHSDFSVLGKEGGGVRFFEINVKELYASCHSLPHEVEGGALLVLLLGSVVALVLQLLYLRGNTVIAAVDDFGIKAARCNG